MVGHVLVLNHEGRTRKWPSVESPWSSKVVSNDVVMFQVNQQRLHSRTKPRGQDEKGAVAGTAVQALKTKHGEIALDLSAAAGPAAEKRQGGDQGRQ